MRAKNSWILNFWPFFPIERKSSYGFHSRISRKARTLHYAIVRRVVACFFFLPHLFFFTFPSLPPFHHFPLSLHLLRCRNIVDHRHFESEVRIAVGTLRSEIFQLPDELRLIYELFFSFNSGKREKFTIWLKKKKNWSTLINCIFKRIFELKFGIFIRSS